MAINWIDIEDQPKIIDAEVDEAITRVESAKDAPAGGADDDSEPEMEIDPIADEFKILPDHQLIKQAAPGLGVPKEAVALLDKFLHALRKSNLEKVCQASSLHAFFPTKPQKKQGLPKRG